MAGLSPSDCERIIIVGAGGFGREVLQWARHAWPSDAHRIAGFLSADPDKLDGHAPTLPILGSPNDFEPQRGDGLLLAIGIPGIRRRVTEQLAARRAQFLTLIHPTAIVADTAQIGLGTIICPYAVVSDSVRLGAFVLINYHAALGHDAVTGDFAVLSPYATLGGHARIDEDVLLGLHASIAPGKTVGARSKVSVNSCVVNNAPAESIIFGVPGRIGPRLAVVPPMPSEGRR
jgi:sugar O-acyltransferase (sialic acid O-acetyltransferase NeuD family)